MFALHPLCPSLLSGGVLLGNLEAAEEVQVLGLCGVHAVHFYDCSFKMSYFEMSG